MKHKALLLSIVVALMLAIASRGSAPAAAQGAATMAPTASLMDPKDVALKAAGGKQLGGTVTILGVLGGAEQDQFLSIFKPFEEATGVKVEYEGTRDLNAILQTRVDGGNAPDIVSSPSVGLMIDFAKAGKLIALSQFLNTATMNANYGQELLKSVSIDGKLYSIFDAVNLGGLIWYNPKTYKGPNPPKSWDDLDSWAAKTAADGTTPWCLGLESGAASGWPGSNWIDQLILLQAGPDKYEQWWQGKLPWSSPEVKHAFETYGKIATDSKMVNGGSTAALALSFQNGADAMYAQPPACYLHLQASFMGGIINGNFPKLKPVEDIDFFPVPGFDANSDGVRLISGEVMGMFNDTPQARALISYFVSTEAQTLVAKTGNWMSANKFVPVDAYPNPFTKRAAETLSSAKAVYYYGSSLMPSAMSDAFWKAVLRYVQQPDQLDSILADLDKVQKDTYK